MSSKRCALISFTPFMRMVCGWFVEILMVVAEEVPVSVGVGEGIGTGVQS